MKLEEILSGESNRMEYKVCLPANSMRYMKSVVAFANGQGGTIVFGISDKPVEIVGVNTDDVFPMMDAIANAISDSCSPAIVPEIALKTVDGKTLVVVDVAPGAQRPYFIKSQGLEGGVYVRVAGTTRQADEPMIRELMFEGAHRSFDKIVPPGKKVSEREIADLCAMLRDVAVRNCFQAEEREKISEVTKNQLLSWGVLEERNGDVLPTNAFYLLSGNWPTVIQCGVFKGKTKAVFVDRREFGGPLHEQIEEAHKFVLRNIHLGVKFNGVYRQDVYELPSDAIRELIVNAVIHRSYIDHGNIQVAVYDNRLEVTSPGKLPMGQSIERMKEGFSIIRNEALARAFSYMRLIEQWGSGIPRIMRKVRDAGLCELRFEGGDTDFRINMYRPESDELNHAPNEPNNAPDEPNHAPNEPNYAHDEPNQPLNEPNQSADELNRGLRLVKLMKTSPALTIDGFASTLNMSKATVKRLVSELQQKGFVRREGTKRKSLWVVIHDDL